MECPFTYRHLTSQDYTHPGLAPFPKARSLHWVTLLCPKDAEVPGQFSWPVLQVRQPGLACLLPAGGSGEDSRRKQAALL